MVLSNFLHFFKSLQIIVRNTVKMLIRAAKALRWLKFNNAIYYVKMTIRLTLEVFIDFEIRAALNLEPHLEPSKVNKSRGFH